MNSTLSFDFWNIRDCNDPIKIKEIKLSTTNNLFLLSVLDIKVREDNEQRL